MTSMGILFGAFVGLLVSRTSSFHVLPRNTYPQASFQTSTTTTLLATAPRKEDSSSSSIPPVEDKMRQDISRLEREAAERLQNLMDQMDDLVEFESVSVGPTIAVPVDASTETTTATQREKGAGAIDAIEVKDTKDVTEQQTISDVEFFSKLVATEVAAPSTEKETKPDHETTKVAKSTNPRPPIPGAAPLDKLAGTSWRLVFNIGREEGTWMPKDWGRSGDRLRFECKVHFTNTTSKSSDSVDDFFHPKPYRLEISDGYLWPTGVGVGRKPLRMDSCSSNSANSDSALFQIVPGTDQGDVLRMRVPLGEAVNRSDVTCPSGNLYVTANYYGLPEWHCRMRDHALHEWTVAQAAYEKAELKLEQAKQDAEEHNHGFGWFGLWKPMAEVWKTKHALEDHQRKYMEAQHRFPEKAHLRFDAKEQVALSREGGLCLKIHSGVAIEYHILGRVEIGCLDKKKTPVSVPPTNAKV